MDRAFTGRRRHYPIRPPCISTICLTMASPRPVPPLALVRTVDLVELLEDGRLMFGRDTGAGIGHTDVEVPVHRLGCYAHFTR
jgi:hypothetical protein